MRIMLPLFALTLAFLLVFDPDGDVWFSLFGFLIFAPLVLALVRSLKTLKHNH